MDEWIITFVLGWLILFLLADKTKLRYTLWGGVAAVIMQLSVDTTASNLGLYTTASKYHLGGGSALFTFGVVFTMGTLFVQFVPVNRFLKIIHILVIATLFLGLEYLLEYRSVLQYHHWHMGASWGINIFVFITLTWIADNFLPVKQ